MYTSNLLIFFLAGMLCIGSDQASIYSLNRAFKTDRTEEQKVDIFTTSSPKYAWIDPAKLVFFANQTTFKAEEELGNLKNTLGPNFLFQETTDSLKNEEITMTTTRLTAELEFKWERDSIQAANSLQKLLLDQEIQHKKEIQYVTILVIVFLLLTLIHLYRYSQSKAKMNRLLQSQQDQISQQNHELKLLDSAKSHFFANISHEFRTPLTLISAPLKSLPEHEIQKLSVSCQHNLNLMRRNSEKLQVLVDDVLNLSKLESGKLELQMKTIHVKRFIRRIWSNFESLAHHLNIHYSLDALALPDEPIQLDTSKTEKIISNILSNAIKHTPGGSSVCLTAEKHHDRLHIRVIDTGYGIAEEDLPYVFDRYYQSKQPDVPIQGGTGIGLSLASEYTKHLGGTLSVERSIVGEGSVFLLDLPFEPSEANDQEIALSQANDLKEVFVEETLTLNGNKKCESNKQQKILVVEDNIDMQQFIKTLLQNEYNVATAFNGKEALQTVKNGSYDLIISDVMMPEMDGFALLKKLRESKTHKSLPIIMLTALSDEEYKLKALSIGVDEYLSKPFSPEELTARVSNMLVRRQTRLQMQSSEDVADKEAAGSVKTKDDLQLITEVERIIAAEMENEEFRLEDMADHFHLSTRQLHRRIKQIVGLSPKEYQREVALQKARRLLEEDTYNNLSAVAYSVGIRNTTRFAQYYENRFGKDPRDYFKSPHGFK